VNALEPSKAAPQAGDIYAEALVWDSHAGIFPHPDTDLSGLDHWRAAGVSFVSLNVVYDVMTWEETIKVLAAYRTYLEANADKYVIAGTAENVRQAKRAGKLAVAFDLEGMNALDGDVNLVSLYYRLGVRQALFAYNLNNAAGGGCHDEDVGLTDFGRAVVREMNRVGMLVDCSHSAYRTTMEAMEISSAPVLFSHSNPKAVWDHGRNIRDEQIKACAAGGGVVGVNGLGIFLGPNDTSTGTLVKHVCYLAELIGPEHVGLGLDYSYDDADLAEGLSARPDYWPPGQLYDTPNIKVAEPKQIAEICQELHARGFSANEITGILGGNFLRVASQVWR
jgi:membrane dipeptidase